MVSHIYKLYLHLYLYLYPYLYIYIYIYIYLYLSQNLSAICYQENKERLQKRALERYQNLLKEEKSDNMVMNVTKISQKMKKKSLLSIEKNIIQ